MKRKITLLLTLFLLTPTLLLAQGVHKRKQDDLSVNTKPTRFYMNDLLYIKEVKDSIVVNMTVQKVDAYGSYYRVRIEMANLRGKSIDFLTSGIEAMSGKGAKREVLKVFSFDKYMSTIRRRRFFLGNAVNYVDNPELMFYPIRDEDIVSYAVEARTIYGYRAHGMADIDRAYADKNTGLYKLRVERNYIRSNTIPSKHAAQGIVMIKRGGTEGDLTVDITIDKTKFRFDWKIDDIPEVKYY